MGLLLAGVVVAIGLAGWWAVRSVRTASGLREALGRETARVSVLERDLAAERGARGQLEVQLAGERERRASSEQVRERLGVEFEAIGARVLRASADELAKRLKGELVAERALARGELGSLVDPMQAALERVQQQLQCVERDRRQSAGELAGQLRAAADSQVELGRQTRALVTALRRPNTRGRWGEMQLENVLRASGMERFCDYTPQPQIVTDDGVLRPDATVRLPGDKRVVIDAKAPLEAFLDAHEADDPAAAKEHLVRHAAQLGRHIERLAEKAYGEQLADAPDFVVLFLPGEHLLSSALEVQPTLIEEAARRNVLLATPATLLTMLKAAHYGWQQQRVAESAEQIAAVGRELYERLTGYLEHVSTLGSRLQSTVKAYNAGVGTLEGRVLPAARRLEQHGITPAAGTPQAPKALTSDARDLRAA